MGRSIMLRIAIAAAALGALALPARATGDRAPAPQPVLTFRSTFAGVAPDHERCLWEGTVSGALRGRVAIALGQVEEPAAAAHPVWHVRARWTVSAEEQGRAFAADLEGMVDWKAGTLRLAGAVTDGWRRGSWVELDGRLVRGDLAGSLAIVPAIARR